MGDDEAARRLLTEAMERRAAMGDHAAASATRQFGLAVSAHPFHTSGSIGAIRSTSASGRRIPGSIPGWLKFLGAALLTGIGRVVLLA